MRKSQASSYTTKQIYQNIQKNVCLSRVRVYMDAEMNRAYLCFKQK